MLEAAKEKSITIEETDESKTTSESE